MSIYIINAFISLFLLLAYGVICVCLGFVAQKWHTENVIKKQKKITRFNGLLMHLITHYSKKTLGTITELMI